MKSKEERRKYLEGVDRWLEENQDYCPQGPERVKKTRQFIQRELAKLDSLENVPNKLARRRMEIEGGVDEKFKAIVESNIRQNSERIKAQSNRLANLVWTLEEEGISGNC